MTYQFIILKNRILDNFLFDVIPKASKRDRFDDIRVATFPPEIFLFA